MTEIQPTPNDAVLVAIGAILDEIIGSDAVARSARRRTHDPSESHSRCALVVWENLQPLTPPDAFDPLVIDDPARLRPQHLRDLAIAEAAMPTGRLNDVGG